ncbi:thiamine phosphate synthase [Desulfococcus sp.]|uniref:thiamine phosphate synthase n=1 Tax=Desulfococcus sp. TaxID=2025834 RepID=UPI00359303DD
MHRQHLLNALRFYFITDDTAPGCSPMDQARIALQAGATMVQYRNKSYSDDFLAEIILIREICGEKDVPFIVNDHIRLAQRVSADGVHLGQDDAAPGIARRILGEGAIVGISVSNPLELRSTDLSQCDYMGTGPVFPTGTKADAKAVKGLAGLKEMVDLSPIPVVAIGGITADNADACFKSGAAGVAVISFISRADDPFANAVRLGKACGVPGVL